MSKPISLEYKLLKFTITYSPGKFDVGVEGPDPVDWMATVVWTLDHDGIDDVVHKKDCRTFNEARNWVEDETGLKYEGLSGE